MKIPIVLGAVVLGVLCSGGPEVRAQAGPSRHPVASPQRQMQGQMMAERKAADARLDALVMAMNMASGEDRLEAAIAVINELVQQRTAMADRMERMHQQMMPAPASEKPAEPQDPHKH